MATKVERLIECYRKVKSLREMMGAGGGGMTTQSNANPGAGLNQAGFSGGANAEGPVAGYDKVDLRKKKYKKLNMFYRQSVKSKRS